MKSRNVFILVLSLLLVLSLAGCKSSSGKTKIRATVWVSQVEMNLLGKMFEKYSVNKSDVEVEYINIEGGGAYGREKLQTMIAGNDAPDVMLLNTGQFEAFAARGVLYNLGTLVQKESFNLDIYWPIAVDGCKYRGTLFGLPKDISNVILFYNKDLFDEAKIPYPTADWKFSDLLAAAKKLTIDRNGDGNIDQWGFALNNVVWAWAGHVWANDGEIFNDDRTKVLLDNAKTIEALQDYFVELNKYSPPPGALPDQGWAGDYMVNKATAMGLFGPWFRPTLVEMETPFRWDVAHYPVADRTGKQTTVVYTDMWGIYKDSKVVEPAWDFIKFLSSKEGQGYWLEWIGAHSISPVIDVARSQGWINYGGSSGNIILDALSYARVPPINFSSAMEVETLWDQEFASVIIGDTTVQRAVSGMAPRIQRILDEMK